MKACKHGPFVHLRASMRVRLVLKLRVAYLKRDLKLLVFEKLDETGTDVTKDVMSRWLAHAANSL